MAISDRNRKLLWGRSGNRCVICRQLLALEANLEDGEALVGDECHIVAQAASGARGSETIQDEPDSYDNLILLCKTDHKRIDDLRHEYTVERLKQLKNDHEHWVETSLSDVLPRKISIHRQSDENMVMLTRVTTGMQLLGITGSCHAGEYSNDDLETEEEVVLVGSFLRGIDDWDYSFASDVSHRLQAEFSLTQELNKMAEAGLVVYAARLDRTITVNNEAAPWRVAVVRVLRMMNPLVTNSVTEQG